VEHAGSAGLCRCNDDLFRAYRRWRDSAITWQVVTTTASTGLSSQPPARHDLRPWPALRSRRTPTGTPCRIIIFLWACSRVN